MKFNSSTFNFTCNSVKVAPEDLRLKEGGKGLKGFLFHGKGEGGKWNSGVDLDIYPLFINNARAAYVMWILVSFNFNIDYASRPRGAKLKLK